MAFQHSVTVGPEFFAKAKNDYRDWKFALAREFIQNGIDAPHCSRILVDVKRDGDKTLLIVANDGEPMDRATLIDKLLCLGASGKDFIGTIGGMGKAKEILYFTHDHYEITTGNLRVTGSGAGYDLEECDYYGGTCSRVWLQGDLVNELTQQFKAFVFMTQWRGHVDINAQIFRCDFRKGSRRREFEWGVVYTNRSISNRLIVRVNGMPMFYRHLDCKNRCVLVELNRGNADVLQANRDALRWAHQAQLDAFIDEVTVDKMSAFRDTSPRYLHFSGDKLCQIKATQMMQAIVSEAYATVPCGPTSSDDAEYAETVVAPKDVNVVDHAPQIAALQNTAIYEEATPQQVQQSQRKSKLTHEFIVKNTTGMEVPAHYQPHAFSSYSIRLTKVWAKTLLVLHELFGREASFSVGFIFDEDREAEYEGAGEYDQVFYLNPITVVRQGNSSSRSFAKRWKLTPAGKYAILSDAIHEFTHSLGYTGHDECYSSKLTELMGVVLTNIKKFYPCFR